MQSIAAAQEHIDSIQLSTTNAAETFGENHISASEVVDVADFEDYEARTRAMEVDCRRRVRRWADEGARVMSAFQAIGKRRFNARAVAPQQAQRVFVTAEVQRLQSQIQSLQAQLPQPPTRGGRRRGSTSLSNRPVQRQRLA